MFCENIISPQKSRGREEASLSQWLLYKKIIRRFMLRNQETSENLSASLQRNLLIHTCPIEPNSYRNKAETEDLSKRLMKPAPRVSNTEPRLSQNGHGVKESAQLWASATYWFTVTSHTSGDTLFSS